MLSVSCRNVRRESMKKVFVEHIMPSKLLGTAESLWLFRA
jgi:hypothetical protein